MLNVQDYFGNIDIYLLDQILKNGFNNGMKIMDAGCGSGRNLIYFLRNGFEVFGVDKNSEAIKIVRSTAAQLAPDLPIENFEISAVEEMPFADVSFDAVLSSAVLHFADDEKEFGKMIDEMWRILRVGGIFFGRLASSIGIEEKVIPLGNRRFLLPDGSERFLVDEEFIAAKIGKFNASWLEPLKTTNVQNLRCMTTVVLRKN